MELDRIFKAYDIRGRVPGELDEEAARRIGAGFARFVGAERIAVGRDCRTSSAGLTDALVDGITASGSDVADLGLVATDMVYYVAGRHQMPGVMVTASHNPPEYNGVKLCRAGAAPVGADSGLEDVKRLAERDPEPGARRGAVAALDAKAGYVDHVLSVVDVGSIGPLRVAVDGGNGMAGVAVPDIFERIDAKLHGLYLEPDGTFPNHHPDPLLPENLVDILALMDRESLDLGVAFDGDADRAFFVDDRLQPLSGSTTTALIAKWFLVRHPGAAIVHNLITSRAVGETIRRYGGRPIRTRVGHSFIKKVMADEGAVFGGEHSGHYYFEANYRADSGMLAMLVLLQAISEEGRPLSEIRTEFEPYHQSGEINLEVEDPQNAVETAAAAFADHAVDRLDGLTVEWDDRWFNLRPSNTEPVVRLNVEAETEEAVEALADQVTSILEEVSGAGA